jgi:hypothetical protein
MVMTKIELTTEMFAKCWMVIQPAYNELVRSGKGTHMGDIIEAYRVTFNCAMYLPGPLQASTADHDRQGNYVLFFENDEDATMFLLRCS